MKKSNEARSSIMELLPREIIIIILSKLPVSSFMQCKLVCKYWRLLVQDNHLFCKHPGLFLQSYYPIKNQLYFARQSIIYQIPLPATLPEFNLVGSSNSFLCFNNSQDTSSIYVYNFCTGVYIVLPEPRKYDEETSTLGFGMDPITKQHKVVRIVCYNSEALLPSSTTSDVQIFSIGSTAWRSLGNVGYSVRNPMQVLVNENLHGLTWALKNGLETRTRIVSFDLANEQLRMVPFVQVAEFDDRPQHFYSLVALGTKIKYILMGSEVLHWGTKEQIDNLVPAMRSLQAALLKDGFKTIKVTTAHSLGMLEISVPPSKGQFWSFYAQPVLSPMLKFLREAKSPFMFNPYPYFGYYQNNSDYVLFRPNKGVYDKYTKITYHNMFEALIDATYSAMKSLGYGDVDIVLGETGWPSVGDPGMNWCTVDNARQYNGNVRKVVDSGAGTPLLPKRKFETYIFSLFNENLKPGSEAERNFGLFRPDFSSVYDIGITRSGSQPVPTPAASGGKKWCVTKQEAISDAALTSNINYACNQGVACSVIRSGGACYNPNNLKSHASYVMNAYYQTHGRNNFNCDFAGTGRIVTSDPSYGSCKYGS